MNGPISASNINVNDITFQVGQARPGRNPPISMRYNGNNLQIKLPRLGYPGGVVMREGETGVKSYTLLGSLKGCDPYGKERPAGTDETGKFYNLLLDLEEHIIKAAIDNSAKWFGKKRTESNIRESFKRIIRFSCDRVDGEEIPNGKYPPSFNVKVPVYDNRVNIDIVDASRNPLTYVTPDSLPSVFPKAVEANLVISGSIYVIAGGGFGVTWRLLMAQVFPPSRRTAVDVFSDESSSAAAELDDDVPPTQSQVPVEDDSYPEAQSEEQVSEAPKSTARQRRVGRSGQ